MVYIFNWSDKGISIMKKIIALASLPFAWPIVILVLYIRKFEDLYTKRNLQAIDWFFLFAVSVVLLGAQWYWIDFLGAGVL